MIDYIKGEIAELTPASVTIETHGIGYFISISLNTYTNLSGQKNAKLFIRVSNRHAVKQVETHFLITTHFRCQSGNPNHILLEMVRRPFLQALQICLLEGRILDI